MFSGSVQIAQMFSKKRSLRKYVFRGLQKRECFRRVSFCALMCVLSSVRVRLVCGLCAICVRFVRTYVRFVCAPCVRSKRTYLETNELQPSSGYVCIIMFLMLINLHKKSSGRLSFKYQNVLIPERPSTRRVCSSCS